MSLDVSSSFIGSALKNTLLVLTISSFFSANVIADQAYSSGFIPEEPAVYAATPQVKRYRAHLPVKVDLSANFPTPGEQGNQSSCVAWATAYAARSYHEKINQGWDANDPTHQFSPAFIYNQIRAGRCNEGSRISDALKLMKSTGVVSLAEFPYDPRDCLTIPDNRMLAHAANFRIANWLRVNEKKLDDIKGQIYSGNPVIFGMSVTQGFHQLKGDEIFTDTITPDPTGGHAMVLVGYDDTKQAFKLLNSWGTDWGNNGFGWVSYAAFLKRVQNAFVMNVATNSKPVIKPKPKPEPVKPKIIVSSKAALELQLTQMLEKIDCAKLTGTVINQKTVHLAGFAGQSSEIENVINNLQRLGVRTVNDVQINPWPQCEVLVNFSEALANPADLKVSVLGKNSTILQEGKQLTIEVVTPSYPSYLYVTYIQANGEAVHLVQPDVNRPIQLNPNSRLVFGDGQQGRALFKVSKPFGNEMIVAIATPTLLFSQKLPNSQIERDYLSQFQPVFLGFTETGVAVQNISAAIATLVTQAKP